MKQTGRPNRKKWCFNPNSYRHFAYLPCTDRFVSGSLKDALITTPAWSYSDHSFLLASFDNLYFKAHISFQQTSEDICWKYRYSFALVTLNNLEASWRTACGVRFSVTSWNFDGSLISRGRNSMSGTLQHPTADTSLRKSKNMVSEGRRLMDAHYPETEPGCWHRAALRYAIPGGLHLQDCMQCSILVSVGCLLVTEPPWTWAVRMKTLICWLFLRKATESVDVQAYWGV